METGMNTGMKDSIGREIKEGDKLILDFYTIHLEWVAKFIDGQWQLYKDEGNHVPIDTQKSKIIVWE